MSDVVKKPAPGEPFALAIPNLGAKDQLPYAKADLVKLTRISGNFALSFYQLDYQALAVAFSTKGVSGLSQVDPIPVAKVVLDAQGFEALQNEMHALENAMAKMEKEHTSGT